MDYDLIHMVIRNRDPDCFKPINYATKSHVNLLNLNFRLAKVELLMKRKIVIGVLLTISIFVGVVIFCDQKVVYNAKGQLYDNVDGIPHREVGLIIGTSPISTWNGRSNYYFDHRIKAGAEL